MDAGETPAAEAGGAAGCMIPIAWAVLAGALLCGCGAWIFAAASDSESAGVTAATYATAPIGFGLAGALGAAITYFVTKNTGVRLAVPAGCGCLGGLVAFGATAFFFAAIFPAL